MASSKLKCRGCGDRFKRATMVTYGSGNFHSEDCAVTYSRKAKQQAKGAKIISKAADDKFAKKKKKFKREDIPHQHNLTQQAFNKMRVLQELKWFHERGIEPYCISCLKTNMDWCCGHYKTVGAQGGLRYDRENTKLQCNNYCNKNLSGNISGNKTTIGYKAGLSHRFGTAEALWVIDYLNATTQTKEWTADELEGIRFGAKKRIRELEAEQATI